MVWKWLALGAVLLAVLVVVVVSTSPKFENVGPVLSGAHPAYMPGTACDATGCHDDYTHSAPYFGPCGDCHTLKSWSDVVYSHENRAMDVNFHGIVGCKFCHTEDVPEPAPDCEGCHRPTKHRSTLPCENCHTPMAWYLPKPLPKGHVSMEGGHTELTCFDCHSGEDAFTSPKQCVTCHGTNHGGMTDCGECHDPQYGWQPKPDFDHDKYYPLTGMHAELACEKCHPVNTFESARPECVTCHGTKHGGLTRCYDCHTTEGFKPSTFRHESVWTLTGAHAKIACSKCHPSNQYANVIGSPWECSSCHGSMHGGLTECGQCHTTTSFVPSTFDHDRAWPLTGKHKQVVCSECHPSSRYANVIGSPSACTNCHGTKHGGLKKCEDCHTTAGFKPSTFKHSSVWRLTGQHLEIRCSECHPNNQYADVIGSPSACTNCHGTKHGGLSRCEDCHTTAGFVPSTFKHSSVWALTGKHLDLDCSECHPDNKYANVIGDPSACTNCHGVAHGNQTRCEDCHTTAGFIPSTVTEHPVYPPLGTEHLERSCRLCHPGLIFSAPTRPCEDCHTAPHVEPTDCARCHTPTVWSDVHFIHAPIGDHTQFPIEEACNYCHTTGNYGEYVCDQCHFPFPYP